MKYNKHKNKIFKSIVAIIIIVAVISAIVLVPKFTKVKPKNNIFVSKKQSYISFKDEFDVSIKAPGGETFYIDSKSSAVALTSPDKKVIFNGFSKDASKYSLADVLNIRLRDKNGNSYIMNSTDNSAEFGTFEVVKQNKTKTSIIFNLFPDKKSAKKGNAGSNVFATITVAFSVKDGHLNTTVDTSDITLPHGFVVEKISILPGLFTDTSNIVNRYYTVPDGPGAVISLDTTSDKPISKELSVYGSDVALYKYDEGAVLPFFAYNKNDCLVNTIITDGDALSEITYKKLSEGGGYLYNTFNITACGIVKGRTVIGKMYQGEISQSYYVNQKTTDYNQIALDLKDVLYKKSYLPQNTFNLFDEYPILVNAVGSVDGKNILTTYENAAEISALLKSRGVTKVVMRLSGADKKGLNTVGKNNLKFSKALGGEQGYNELVKSINEQQNDLYSDVNVLLSKKTVIKNIKPYESTINNMNGDTKNMGVNSVKRLNKNIASVYKSTLNTQAKNICLNDMSYLLFSDLKNSDRQTVMNVLKNNISSMSINGNLILSHPAVYLMNQTQIVFNVPQKADNEDGLCVKTVPILQMVLHGSVVYGSEPLNVIGNVSIDDFLKNIEYGSVPTFLFTHSGAEKLNYGAYVTEGTKLYSKAQKLKPILNMQITCHEKVASGVYKITYDYSKVVYVNYNPSVVEVNGLMISPKDFVIV